MELSQTTQSLEATSRENALIFISYQATSIRESTVASNKNISSNCLPEYFNTKNICNHLLSFLIKTIHNKQIKLKDTREAYKLHF